MWGNSTPQLSADTLLRYHSVDYSIMVTLSPRMHTIMLILFEVSKQYGLSTVLAEILGIIALSFHRDANFLLNPSAGEFRES